MYFAISIVSVFFLVQGTSAFADWQEERDAKAQAVVSDTVTKQISVALAINDEFWNLGVIQKYRKIEALKGEFGKCLVDTVKSVPELNPDILLRHLAEGFSDPRLKAAYDDASAGRDIFIYASSIRHIVDFCLDLVTQDVGPWRTWPGEDLGALPNKSSMEQPGHE